MKIVAWIAIALVVLLAFAGVYVYGAASGWFGRPEVAGSIAGSRLPDEAVTAKALAQQTVTDAHRRTAPSDLSDPSEARQILFGDLHVHTTFSFDAFLLNLPITGGSGTHPPADACDFARYCAQLDFWSINDHAENITPRLWSETVRSIRDCDAAAGDPSNPDMVSYLGWEWSQIGRTPETHYGHKNVVLKGLEDDQITARPIASSVPGTDRGSLIPFRARALIGLAAGRRGLDYTTFLREVGEVQECPTDVPVRELPTDCLESTQTPEELFAKLREWDVPSVVIPHGTSWGLYTPAGSDWAKQLPGQDPELQKLVEIYSGHGNSEEYRAWRAVEIAEDRSLRCPEPRIGYLPSCWQSGEILRTECLAAGADAASCELRAAKARQDYVDSYQGGWKTIGGYPAERWLDSGQCRDCFQGAFNYRPLSSVQYMLALRDFSNPAEPKRFDFGFIGSSDIHSARPGTGFKERFRGAFSDGRGRVGSGTPGGAGGGVFGGSAGEPRLESMPMTEGPASPLALFEIERGSAFFTTGGLVAVHASGRDRDAIWLSLDRKEVYATSGPRILLWFDLLEPTGKTLPMGSKTVLERNPRFRVRAAGSLVQKPGCPDFVTDALGAERTAHICMDECYHPSNERRRISRIEIVRIRPQTRPNEPIGRLVQDPWRSYTCPDEPHGCTIEFSDRDFVTHGRDTVYYARAIEETSLAIHGSNPLNCSFDNAGNCVEIDSCNVTVDTSDDCLSPTEQRAWSSPIYVDYAKGRPPGT